MTLRLQLPDDRDWLDRPKVPGTAGVANEARLAFDLAIGRAQVLRTFVRVSLVSGPTVLALNLLSLSPVVSISAALWAAALMSLAMLTGYAVSSARNNPRAYLRLWYGGIAWGLWLVFLALKLGELPQGAYLLVFLPALAAAVWLSRAAASNLVLWRTCEGFLDATRDRLREEYQAGRGRLRLLTACAVGFFLVSFGGPMAFWGFVVTLAFLWSTARLRSRDRLSVGLAFRLGWLATVVLLGYNPAGKDFPGSFQTQNGLLRAPAGRVVAVAGVVAMLHAASLKLNAVMWPWGFDFGHIPLAITVWFFHLAAYVFLPLGLYLVVLLFCESDALLRTFSAVEKEEALSAERRAAEEEDETW